MSMIVPLGFGLSALGFTEDPKLGRLTIDRDAGLGDKDLMEYTVLFETESWAGKPRTAEVKFKHRYSWGALSLVAAAVKALLKAHPDLKAGRYGVPRNRIKCGKCGTVAWSKHRHDFTRCRCGAVSTDGGYDYIRRSIKPGVKVEQLSEPWQESDSEKASVSSAASAGKPSPRKRTATPPTPTPRTRPSTKTAKSTATSPCFYANAALRSGVSGMTRRTRQ